MRARVHRSRKLGSYGNLCVTRERDFGRRILALTLDVRGLQAGVPERRELGSYRNLCVARGPAGLEFREGFVGACEFHAIGENAGH
jgi:hypothetical protein